MTTVFRMAVLATTLVVSATASTTVLAQVSVSDPWVRATVPAQKATGAFMTLTAKQNARLIDVKSSTAGLVEVHEMRMDGDIMKMRALSNGLELPAGKAVELKPGGYHVMLMDLKQQIKAGDSVPLTLVLENADKSRSTIEVKATAKPLDGGMVHTH